MSLPKNSRSFTFNWFLLVLIVLVLTLNFLAISTLETLRQENKTVGVISHVDFLKERIATQIVVEKQSGGISGIRLVS